MLFCANLVPRIVIFKGNNQEEKEKSEIATGIKKPGRPGKKSTMREQIEFAVPDAMFRQLLLQTGLLCLFRARAILLRHAAREASGCVMDKPVISAFPGFLQDFAYPVFIFFQAANDGQIVIGGKAYGYLAWKSRELLFNASGEFII
ncbi:hypothetical protein OO18_02775 [Raoultella ornithinolytica]|nr:hypothetical protein OO18_02775 [Raoultella ornithinolytica]